MNDKDYILKLEHERWYLINYLEDKIEKSKKELTELKKHPETNEYEILKLDTKQDTYQEILDKIKESNYESK